jgi:hypothetical protein
MGAITRAAANNITTGGVILPAGINDASVASVTGLAQVSAGDGITLISSQTASSSASLSFTTGIDSTYRTYLFKFINIHAGTNEAKFQFNLSTDSGSNYNVTKTTTAFRGYHDEADTQTNLSYNTGQDLAQSTAYQTLTDEMGTSNNDESLVGEIYLFNPSSTTFVKHFLSITQFYQLQPASRFFYIAGYGNTTSAINAIDFKFLAET